MRVRIAAGVAVLAFVLLGALGIAAAWPAGELRDYGSFVASGRAATNGDNPYGIHPLTFHVVLPAFEVWNPNLNPPISIPVFQLFDRIDPQRGFVIWWWFSVACYAAAVALLVRRYGAGPAGVTASWAFALAGFWDTLALGQIYLPLVLCAVASWLLLERGRSMTAGVLIGFVIAVKPNFAAWPALLLLAGHYRAPLAAAITAACASAVPLVLYGGGVYAQWAELILSDKGRAAFLTNASLPGLAERVGLGPQALVVGLVVLAALAWTAARQRPDAMGASAIGIAAGILASPIAWVHYTLFLLPVFFACRVTAPLAAAAALLTVPVPLVLRLTDAPVALQATVGSVYTWAVLLCLIAVLGLPRRDAVRSTAAPGLSVPASYRP
jgi:hypothetical protein